MKKIIASLRDPTKRWTKKVRGDFELESHHVRLLLLAAQAWDRAAEARDIIALEGPVIKDRFEQPKPHPAIAIENQSMLTFAKLLRELGLDLVRPDDPRPPSNPGGY